MITRAEKPRESFCTCLIIYTENFHISACKTFNLASLLGRFLLMVIKKMTAAAFHCCFSAPNCCFCSRESLEEKMLVTMGLHFRVTFQAPRQQHKLQGSSALSISAETDGRSCTEIHSSLDIAIPALSYQVSKF